MINIPSYIKDPSYRYQMPALKTKVEGSGNGIKTKLVNLFEVSRHLGVPTEYILRYFGIEFGAIIEFKQTEQKAMLKGEVRREDLQISLDHFIENFVLCPKCKYPEIRIRIKKKELFSDCKACGEVRLMNMTHKISNFILKFPPKVNEKDMPDNNKPAAKVPLKKKKKSKKEDVITLKSPDVIESLERLAAEDRSRAGEVLSSLALSKDFDTDIRAYLMFKGIFGDELLSLLQQPAMIQILKSFSGGCAEDILMAFACVYGADKNFNAKISSAMFHFYNNDIFSEELFDNWVNDNLDFNEASPVYNENAINSVKINSQQFLDWLINAEVEEEEEKEECSEPKQADEEIKENIISQATEENNGKNDENNKEKDNVEKKTEIENIFEISDPKDIMSQLKTVEDFNIDDI